MKVPYADAVNANNNFVIDITNTFNDVTLDYVVLDKYGLPEDYADIDIAGKIAVINRGGFENNQGLTFEAKAKYAEAAGAVAVIVVNNEPGTIARPGVTTSDIIPMIGVAQSAGAILAEAPSKKIYFSKTNEDYVENPGAGLISSFSSIGPSPELGLKPEITAPGGNIYSTMNGGKYALMSGTSMATPHMAGISAILKQYLNENAKFSYLSESEKADLITYLEMSTATPIKNTEGNYYPVRQQGAGLVNVFKAANTSAYLTVDGNRPKVELKSNTDGTYSIHFTVNNISDKPVTYKINIDTLTGKLRNNQYLDTFPRALTSDEAIVDGVEEVIEVAPNSSRDVSLTITLSEAVKTQLNEQFVNGIYVEGFVRLDSQDEEGINLTLPFLGFYGDWGSLPTVDQPIYKGTPLFPIYTALLNVDGQGLIGRVLGENQAATPVKYTDKLAFSTVVANGGHLTSRLSLLRNADNITFSVVSEDDSTEYWKEDYGPARKTYYYANGGRFVTTSPQSAWNGKDKQGNILPDDTRLKYVVSVSPAGGSELQKMELPFTIDNSAPVIKNAQTIMEDEKTYLELEVSDNQSIKYMMFTDTSGHIYALDNYVPDTDVQEDTVKVDISNLAKFMQEQGYNPGKIAVYTYDYASNHSIDYVEFGPSAIVLDKAKAIKSGDSVTLQAAVKPDKYSNSPISWSVDNEAIGTISADGTFTAKSKGIATVIATSGTGLKGTTKIYVDTELPDGTDVTEPGDTEPAKYVGDIDHGDLSISGDHTEIIAELNQVFQVDGFDYRITGNNEVQLIADQSVDDNSFSPRYPEKSGEIVLPDIVERNGKEYKITSIGAQAFYYTKNVTGVIVPDGVTVIGKQAFAYSSNLKKVVLPDSVERIDEEAFAWQSNTEVNIPKNLKYIGRYALVGNQKLSEVKLNPGFQEIGYQALGMTSVTSIYLPDGVKAIGANAFINTPKLNEIRLPADLKRIPKAAFYASGIQSIELPTGLESIGPSAFQMTKLTEINIPSTVTRIEPFAFSDISQKMDTVILPDSVQVIQENAFKGLSANSIVVGANALRIDKDAFISVKSSLQAANEVVAKQIRRSNYSASITVGGSEYSEYVPGLFLVDTLLYRPTSDTTAEVQAMDNKSVYELVIPEKVTDTGNNVTYTVTSVASHLTKNATNLNKIVLPDTIERIGERAFDQNLYLKTFNYPKNLKELGYQGLGYSGQQEPLYNEGVDLEIPQSIEWADDSGFAGIKERQIKVPTAWEYINEYEFAATKYAKSIQFGDVLKTINRGAFMGAEALTSVQLPDSLVYIGDEAFANSGLATVTIPDSVQYIGSRAFNQAKEVTLGGSVNSFNWDSFGKDTKVSVVLNSQLENVVKFNTLKQLPSLNWDGGTAIMQNDSSLVQSGTTVTIKKDSTSRSTDSALSQKASTLVLGKLTVDGTLNIPAGETLYLNGQLMINGNITGQGTLMYGAAAKFERSKIAPTVSVVSALDGTPGNPEVPGVPGIPSTPSGNSNPTTGTPNVPQSPGVGVVKIASKSTLNNGLATVTIADQDLQAVVDQAEGSALKLQIAAENARARLILSPAQVKLISELSENSTVQFNANTADLIVPSSLMSLAPAGHGLELRIEPVADAPAIKAALGNGKLLGTAYAFEATWFTEHTSKEVKVPINMFITRSFSVPNNVQPNTAGVLFEAAGVVTPVAATFNKQADGTTTVTVRRPGFSVYAVATRSIAFTDINKSFAADNIAALANQWIINGTTESTFSPKTNLTRAEFTALLVRALGLKTSGKAEFTDVKTDAWFASEVAAASEAGLIKGLGQGEFAPNAVVTREDMAVILDRALQMSGSGLTAENGVTSISFEDESSIAAYAKDSVKLLSEAGIINGIAAPSGKIMYRPDAPTTREAAAAMLHRLLVKASFID